MPPLAAMALLQPATRPVLLGVLGLLLCPRALSAHHGTLQSGLPAGSRPLTLFPETDGNFRTASNKPNASPRLVSEWPMTYQDDGFLYNFPNSDDYDRSLKENHWSNGSRLKRESDISSFVFTKFEGYGECFEPCATAGGFCFQNSCSCRPSHFGPSCDQRLCPAPFVKNGLFARTDDNANHLLLSCLPNFGFADDLNQTALPSPADAGTPAESLEEIDVYCVDGKWKANSSIKIEDLACVMKTCSVSCQNGGDCGESPYKCECPEKYFGQFCELLEDFSPGEAMNDLSYEHAKYTMAAQGSRIDIVCDPGYELPGGARSMPVRCSQGRCYIGVEEIVSNTVACSPTCPGGCGPGRCVAPESCLCPDTTTGSHCAPVHCSDLPSLPGAKLVNASLSKSFATFECEEGLATSHPFPRVSSGLLACLNGRWGLYANYFIAQIPEATPTIAYSLDSTLESIVNSKSSPVQSRDVSGMIHDISYVYDKYGYIKINEAGGSGMRFLLNKQRFENLLDSSTTDRATTVETYILFSQENPLQCEPIPGKDCGPFGFLDKNKICQCEDGFSGDLCEKKSCLVSIPTVTNGFTSVRETDVKYTCPPGYTLGEGITEGHAKCTGYMWKLDSNVPASLTCEPICNFALKQHEDGSFSDNEAEFMKRLTPMAKNVASVLNPKSCLFSGRCVKPNFCECPEGNYGDFCQVIGCTDDFSQSSMNNVEVQPVKTGPNDIPRLDLVCTNDKTKRYELVCVDGRWFTKSPDSVSTRIVLGPATQKSPVLTPVLTAGYFDLKNSALSRFVANNKVCPPVCTKPCLNNGQCVRNDMCLCSSEFTGPDCSELRCMKDLSTIILRGSISQSVQTNATAPSPAVDELTCSEGFVIAGAMAGPNVRQSVISCSNGRYILEASGEEISEASCTPYCPNSCLNGGVCEAPNTCACTEGYAGISCEEKACKEQADVTVFTDGDSLFLACPFGKFFTKNISTVEVVCSDGVYVAADESTLLADDGTPGTGSKTEVKCVQGCVKKCENKGVCSGIDMCTCEEGFQGQFCASKSCSRVPQVNNGHLNFTSSESKSAVLTCDAGFSDPSGGEEVEVVCIEGSWYSAGGDQGSFDPSAPDTSLTYPVDDVCTKHCREDCKNGGVCIAKNTCQCPDGFEGSSCEQKVCALIDVVNGFINKSENGYFAICDDGYFFSSGLSEVSVVCEGGSWKFPSQSDSVGVAPQCLEGCKTPCENGGKCVGFDTCQCFAEYEGDRCENIGCPSVYPKLEHGNFELIDGHVTQVCDEGFIHHEEMGDGEIRCFEGEWTIQLPNMLAGHSKYYDCVEECTSECQNGGTCLGKIKGCACIPPFRGEFCEYKDCDMAQRPPVPLLSKITFERTEYDYETEFACPKGFFYQTGSKAIRIACQNGNWVVIDGDLRFPFSLYPGTACEEGCPEGCANGGTCAGVGVCECLDGYEGDRCERLVCKLPSAPEINGNIMKTEEGSRFLVCHEGYELEGGSVPLEVHCVNSFWVPISVDISETSISEHEFCKPKCEPPCKNGGVCASPGKCNCPPKTTGSRCADFICANDPPTTLVNGTIEKRSPSEVTYLCDEGYRFISGQPKSFLKCMENGWSLIEEDGEVSLLQPEDLVCERLKTCEDELPTVRNAMLVYVGEEQTPLLRCYDGYSLQTGDGKKEFEPLCVDGQWLITMSQKLGCVPECPLGCRNGGVCVAPSVCQCPKEYGGAQCQDKLCLQPLKGNNFTVSVIGPDVFATCETGYLFKYGEPSVRMECQGGEWVYPSSYASHTSLVCVPVCMPPCENGGTCIAPGVCGCNENYSGDLCQNREACSSVVPQLPNSVTENVGSGFYLIKCAPSFAFTSNVKWLELRCQDGNWSYTGYEDESSLPRCLSLTGVSCDGNETTADRACGLLYAPECEILPPVVPNAIVSYNSSGGEVVCDEGYLLNTEVGSTPFKCFGDQWSYPECETDELPICKPKCKIPCRNGGECTAPESCTCQPGFTGPLCGEMLPQPCIEAPPAIPNAAVLISVTGQYVVCAKGYQFPSERLREQIWCKDGEWMFKTQSTDDLKRGCYPVCSGGCLNGGVCTAPDVCSCVRPFTGTNCGKLVQESCVNPASSGTNLELEYNSTLKISSCSAGYLPTIAGAVTEEISWEETCRNGKWGPRGSDQDPTETASEFAAAVVAEDASEAPRNCSPICKRPCLNGGVCSEPDTCTCPSGYTGPTCEALIPANCSLLPPVVDGGYITYRYPEKEVVVQCSPGYELMPQVARTTLQCRDGKWFTSIASQNVSSESSASYFEGSSGLPEADATLTLNNVAPNAISDGDNVASEYSPSWYPLGTLRCAAVCQKPCLNNGTCIAPEKCTCLSGYAGDQCQVEKCYGAPKKIRNSMMIFSDDYLSGVSRCRSGYKFPNGDIAARFLCKNRAWVYQKDYVAGDEQDVPAAPESARYGEGDASVEAPYDSCLPLCSQPCLNGGWCVAPNTCRCTEGFFGDSCNKRYSKTVNGSDCVFPFVFRGTRHFGCTGSGHHKPWCATAVTETEQVAAWDICVADLGLKKVVLTEDLQQCVFPFVYRNIEYHRCTTVERTRGWCATKVHQKVMVDWSFCAADQGGSEIAITSEGVVCQLPFQYGNRVYTSCVEDAHTPWCVVGEKQPALRDEFQKAIDARIPESEIVYGVCLAHWGHTKVEVTRQGHLCVFPFEFEGKNYTSCVTNSTAPPGSQLWCATQVSRTGDILATGICIDERDLTRLSSTLLVDVYPHLNLIFPNIRTMGSRWCVFPFTHKKKLYTSCTMTPITPGSLVGASIDTYAGKYTAQARGRRRNPYWCATSVDVDSTVLEYDICSDDWKRDYENFTRSQELRVSFFPPGEEILIQIGTKNGYNCSVPFVYRGLRYFGCVTEEGGKFVQPWCAVSTTENGTPLLTDECVADWDRNCPASALQPQPALMRDRPPSAMFALPTEPTIMTLSGTPCVIPFMYQGRKRSNCIGDTKPWCPTQIDHTGDPLAWDYCPESLPNVPRDETDDQRPAMQEPLLTATQTFTVKGFRCVFPFVYDDVSYEACTSAGRASLWCATGVDLSGRPTSIDDCVLHDDDNGGYTDVMTRSGLPCVFPFYYKQHQFSTCTRYSTELHDFIKSDTSQSFDPSKLYTTPDQFTKNMPQGASSKVSPDVFRDYGSLSGPILDTEHEDFAAISAAQVTRLSEINLDGQRMKEDENAWCAVAVDSEGVVTMKSECVGSFKTDAGVRTFQAFYTSNLQENFGSPKTHDVNVMEKFLEEDESSWAAASRDPSMMEKSFPYPRKENKNFDYNDGSDAETWNYEGIELSPSLSPDYAGAYRQYRSSGASGAWKEWSDGLSGRPRQSWSLANANYGQPSAPLPQKTISTTLNAEADGLRNLNSASKNFLEYSAPKRMESNFEGEVPVFSDERRW